MMTEYQWLTTQSNPRSPEHGIDRGVRGWRLHAVGATEHETFEAVKFRRAVCGLRARHGWGMDLFIDRKCARCAKALAGKEKP